MNQGFFGDNERLRKEAAQIIEKQAKQINFIPFLKGRPERITVISLDDICNLRIALNTSDSIEEFLTKV